MKVSNMKTGYFRIDRNSKSVALCIALAGAVLALGTVGCGPSASSESDSTMTTASEDGSAADFNFNHAWLVIPPAPSGSYITPPPGEESFQDRPDVARSGYTDPSWERVDDADVSDTDARVLELPRALDPRDPAAKPDVQSYGCVDMRHGPVLPLAGAGTSDPSGLDNEDENP
jgi:hypothetical protein